MIPLHLDVENFTCHIKSEIDFTQFDSAVIVGKMENNSRRANGIGKSKLFAAINYALYNETPFSDITNIIRDDADKCRVTFTFQVGTDIYRVERSRGRKANSADLRLFRKDGEAWEDLTERTSSGTEKAILKIVKINYKTFVNSVYFAQNDLSGLARLTPTDRKNLLKEALQLNVYSALEKLGKKRLSSLSQEITKTKTLLGTFVNLDTEEEAAVADLARAADMEASLKKDRAVKDAIVAEVQQRLASIQDSASKFEAEMQLTLQKSAQLTAFVKSITAKRDDYYSKLTGLKNSLQAKIDTIAQSENQLVDLKKIASEIEAEYAKSQTEYEKTSSETDTAVEQISAKKEQLQKELIEKRAAHKSYQTRIAELRVPLPDGPVCRHCKQVVTEEHREICEKQTAQEISEKEDLIKTLLTEISGIDKAICSLNEKQAKLLEEKNASALKVQALKAKLQSYTSKVSTIENDIAYKKRELDASRTTFDDYKSNYIQLKKEAEQKTKELEEIEEQKKSLNLDAYNQAKAAVASTTSELRLAQAEVVRIDSELSRLASAKAVSEHKLANIKNSKEQKSLLEKKLSADEDNFNLHSSVCQAFGSKGIPSLIIHNLLDDLQIHANDIISQIKPGLQLEFEIDKENKKGEQTDTLEIKYRLNNRAREFDQLSGGQQLIVTLGLRLALSLVIQKSFGIDIKFLMLDEVDPALDEESLDLFLEMLRIMEKDFKILIITHNNYLKDKFNHAILVEQDMSMNSIARLVSSW